LPQQNVFPPTYANPNYGDGVNKATAVGFLSLLIQQLENIHAYQLDIKRWPNKSILRKVQ